MKMIITLADKPGALFRLMDVFQGNEINIKTIRSQAVVGKPEVKAFFIEAHPHHWLKYAFDKQIPVVSIDAVRVEEFPETIELNSDLTINLIHLVKHATVVKEEVAA